MKQTILLFALSLFVVAACADDYTIQGSWVDPTVTGPGYVAQYHAQCQVDAVQVYEDLALATPGFSTVLAFAPGSALECRVRQSNIVVPSVPVDGPWSAWIAGVAATTPAAPGQIILIQITP